ncbi:anillin, actin binding protein 2 [Engraulis encrasicolus]|uniref:anillin, actin binding protein 2 n=1 Tax=Engraulis encrasicolus TaxID=184585 RepID=UPI002FD056E6
MESLEEWQAKRQRDEASDSDSSSKRRRVAKENIPVSPKANGLPPPKPDTPALPSIHSRIQALAEKVTGAKATLPCTPRSAPPPPRSASGLVQNVHRQLQAAETPSTSQAALIRQQRQEELSVLHSIQPVAANAWQKGWKTAPAATKDLSLSFASSDGNQSLAPIDLSQEDITVGQNSRCLSDSVDGGIASTPTEMSTSAMLDEIFKDVLEAAKMEEEEEQEENEEDGQGEGLGDAMEKGEREQMEKKEEELMPISRPVKNNTDKTTTTKEEDEENEKNKAMKKKEESSTESMKEKKMMMEIVMDTVEENKKSQQEEEGRPEKTEEEEKKDGGMQSEGKKEEEDCKEEEEEEDEDDEDFQLPPSCILSPLSESVEKVVTPLRLAAVASISSRLSFHLPPEGPVLQTPPDTQPGPYSVDAYRSKARSGQKVMRVTPWRQEQEKTPAAPQPQPPPTVNAKEKIKALKEEAAKLATVISQTQQALSCCVDEQHGKGSVEEAEAERLLLISSEKREALLSQVEQLEAGERKREGEGEGESSSTASTPPLQPCRGSILISQVHLPLKVDFVCSARNAGRPSHYFFILFRYGPNNILATPLATAADAKGDTISFTVLVSLEHIRSTFEIDVEVYSMSDTPNAQCDDSMTLYRKQSKQRVTPKKLIKTLKRSHQQANAAGPSSLGARRPSKFSLVGCHKITLASLGQTKFPLDKMKLDGKIRKLLGDEFQDKVPFLSPLEGHIHLNIESKFHSEVTHHGFLTMFKDISGLGSWHRLFFVLADSCLHYWNHPNERDSKPAEGSIALANFRGQSVRPVKSGSCARPLTFELVNDTQEEEAEDASALNKRWFAADTAEERGLWMERLNQALLDLSTWTPPDQNQNQDRASGHRGTQARSSSIRESML